MRRHHIRIGDLTTANGVVVSAASTFFLLDKQVATEGDKIACRSCHSTGTIVCICPRIPEYYEGRQVALEGDFCVCRCPGPPRLIPSQGIRFQEVEGGYESATGGSSGGISAFAAAASSSKKPTNVAVILESLLNEQTWVAFRLEDSEGHAIANERYELTLPDGRLIKGQLDGEGTVHIDKTCRGRCTIAFPDINTRFEA